MSGAGFQGALAELLTVPAARRAFNEQPTAFATRFGLTVAELGALMANPNARLELNATTVVAKRLSLVRRGLPATTHVLFSNGQLDRVLASFVEHCEPHRSATDVNRQLVDGQRFADHLRTFAPQGMSFTADLAAYEVALARLSFGTPSSVGVDFAGSRLGDHVELARFDVDVVQLHEEWLKSDEVPASPPYRPTWLVLARIPGRVALARFRLGEKAYAFLDRARGGNLVATSDGERAVIRFAQEQGLLGPPMNLEN